jgi:hypothetical protein
MRPIRLLAVAILLGLPCGPLQADVSLEYAVKAAYLPKFIPFITWPESAFASSTAPFTICVVGQNRFEDRLDKAAAEARSGDHPVQVRRLAAPEPGCQLVFLTAGTDPALVQSTLEGTHNHPVVTVIDSGLKARGVISFVIQDNHVRFDIDDALAADGGLSISSKLLGLAHAVKPRGQQ